MDLRHLSYLRIFAINAIIKCDAQEHVVLRDINLVLSTIPKANQVIQLSLKFTILLSLEFTVFSYNPFDGFIGEDWAGMCDEVVRISAGKPLELNLKVSTRSHRYLEPPGESELYERIKEKIASLPDYPNICVHFQYSEA